MRALVTEKNPDASVRVRMCQKSKIATMGVLHYGSDGDQEDDCAWLITKMKRG